MSEVTPRYGPSLKGPEERWVQVERYLVDLLVQPDAALNAALEASDRAKLPAIAVSPNEGKLLYLLARAVNAKAILEIGTLGGYSAIWLARALAPGGKLLTLEFDPRHADVARENLQRAGVADRAEVRVGNAISLLPELEAERAGPFDLVFIDADKPGNPEYFRWAVKLTRPGGLIIVDNVVRDGRVIDASSNDPSVEGVRKMHEVIRAEPRVSATAVQTVGSKGYDGFTIAIVNP